MILMISLQEIIYSMDVDSVTHVFFCYFENTISIQFALEKSDNVIGLFNMLNMLLL